MKEFDTNFVESLIEGIKSDLYVIIVPVLYLKYFILFSIINSLFRENKLKFFLSLSKYLILTFSLN